MTKVTTRRPGGIQHDLFGRPGMREGDRVPMLDATLDQWFTPSWAAEELMADALAGMGDVAVIEPSCGSGSFLACIPAGCDAVGVEIDPRMAQHAAAATGRPVIVGDFASVDLPDRPWHAIIGNPPFGAETIDRFVARSHALLEDDGIIAMIMPAHVLSTTDRVERWGERFSMEQRLIPRSLFPRLSLPLVWTRMIKGRQRTMTGFLLFGEATAVQAMPQATRQALGRRGSWREAIAIALESLGGEASLREIYAAVEPRRPTANQFWRDKIRQELPLAFQRVDATRWRMPEAMAA